MQEHRTPRRKRNPKAPSGVLGQKLRAKVIPSSLPPSSPVASWSDDILALTFPIEDEYDPATEFDSRHSETTKDTLSNFDANSSDPFGFFAVEKKLKAERLGRPKPPPTRDRRPLVIRPAQQKISPSVSRSSSPPAQSSSKDNKNGQDRKTRDSDDDEPPKSSTKGKKVREPLDPARLAAKLTALLPKKPSREVNRKTESRKRPSNKETTRLTRSRSKLQAMTRQNNETNDEEDERLGLERQARLEYYNKLDRYSIAKENVYVI